MKLAVVIPAFEESEGIDCSIRSALVPGVEVVVVDGGSHDDTVLRARRAGARVIEAPRGRASQLAAGAEASAGEAIVFLHADTLLPPGWHEAVRAALAAPGTVGGSFAFRFDRRNPRLRVIEWGVRLRMALANLPYGDQGIFVRRDVLERIGGIPQVALMEDLDLVRILKREGRLARLPLAVVTSARRYVEGGALRTMARNWLALAGWRVGLDRARIARWVGR